MLETLSSLVPTETDAHRDFPKSLGGLKYVENGECAISEIDNQTKQKLQISKK